MKSGDPDALTDEREAPEPWRPSPFRPPWWLRGRHAQTLGGKLFRPRADLGLRRERVDTPDGDFVDLDFMPEPEGDGPLVLVLHGLEGSARRNTRAVILLLYHVLVSWLCMMYTAENVNNTKCLMVLCYLSKMVRPLKAVKW